jgi:hypothetical protein
MKTKFVLVALAIHALVMAAIHLHAHWTLYLSIWLLAAFVLHYLVNSIWIWRITWLFAFFTAIIFILEAPPIFW